MYDIVIRNGKVIDGTGAPGFIADIAIQGDKIACVGKVSETGVEEIDANGKIVAPGFVDIHTHYDGQATWDSYLAPSSNHGVTTTVIGNCGVGFAPVRPDQHEWLINLMEGVEDIPGTALAEGLTWNWETFPEYLDALEARSFTMDIGTHVPHAAVRSYVMAERATSDDPASPDDIAKMAHIIQEGIEAGALGFSSSRVIHHRARTGELIPGTTAGEEELEGIFRAMARGSKKAVFEVAIFATDDELALLRRLSKETGLPVSIGMLQENEAPERWRAIMKRTAEFRAEGINIRAQITVKSVGMMFNWRASLHPFVGKPSWTEIVDLPWEQQLAKLREPAFRQQMISEPSDFAEDGPLANVKGLLEGFHLMYANEGNIDPEPDPASNIAARAQREGVAPLELVYDALMSDDGNGFVIETIFNYSYGNYDHIVEMMEFEGSLFSLADGGAHVGMICDASNPTFLMTHWSRDRKRGKKARLEEVIRRQTSETAGFYGLLDRGIIAPGFLADLNVIDYDNLKLENPYIAFDLPAGGMRILQNATGYTATIKSGVVVSRDGEFTGELPGRLVRGHRDIPATTGQA